jgi:2-polyprenyl-6-methoxyphenol hydroxylase-like FAD-dependent oxidoreductase
MPPHVIIVGAGLTGPALAIALARQSIRSTIVERHPSPRNIGGVILLAVNALRVLDKAVGVEPLLRKAGYSYDAINIYTEGNNALDKVGGFLTTNAGIKGITIKRPILHDILLDRCTEFGDMIEIKYGTKIVEIDEQPDHVEAVMEDGSRLRGEYRRD